MKLPRFLNVKGVKYKVKELDLTQVNQYGHCDPFTKTIAVHNKLGPKEKMETYLHEMIHAICTEVGIRQCQNWSIDVEELVAENVSTFLVENLDIKVKK